MTTLKLFATFGLLAFVAIAFISVNEIAGPVHAWTMAAIGIGCITIMWLKD